MRMNRRNVLVGLGGIVAGGGALLGTGAFSSVEATRDVDISAAGDDDALIGIIVEGDLAGDDPEKISFELGENVNLNADTTFSDVLTLENNREDEEDNDVDFQIYSGEGTDGDSLITYDSGEEDPGMYFVVDEDEETDISPDDYVTFDVVFTLEDDEDVIPDEITIEAKAS